MKTGDFSLLPSISSTQPCYSYKLVDLQGYLNSLDVLDKTHFTQTCMNSHINHYNVKILNIALMYDVTQTGPSHNTEVD